MTNITIWQVNKSDGRNMPPYVQGKTLAFWFTGLSLYLCNFCHYFNCILPLSKVIIYEAFNIFIRIEAGCFHHLPLRFWRKSENMATSEYKKLWSYEINKLEKVFLATYYYVYLCLISDQEKKEDLYNEKKYFYCISNKTAP